MEFRILGPLEILRDGVRVPLGHRREQRVLAALLLDANRPVPVARLVDTVWEGDPPRTAEKAIRNCVSTLRRLLADPGPPDELIVTDPAGYLLHTRPEQLDAAVFEQRVAHARRLALADQPRLGLHQMRAALALWRGRALAGVGGAVIEAAAAGFDERRLAVLEESLSLAISLGEDHGLVGELSALVAENPLRERLRGLLMLALYRCGRRTEALTVYREGRRILVDEVGLEPGSELRTLEMAILKEDLPVVPATATHRPSRPAPAQMPADVTAFVGRAFHLRQMDAARSAGEQTGAMTILTVVGTAGVGKTALAVHWGHRVRDRFPDGQLYVDLRGHASGQPMRAIGALARFLPALGVAAEHIPIDLQAAAAMYRTLLADRRVLVVLDNAASPDQVRSLLPGSPGCMVVITSRDRLAGLVAKEGARRITLDVLTAADASLLLTRVIGAERVHAEAAAAAALARLCDYLPLALRIAAANLAGHTHQSIDGYVTDLTEGNRLAALSVEGDDQATVRAAFDLSYATLTPDAGRMFRRLGIAPGRDLTTDTASVLADVSHHQAAWVLDQLAAVHLVRPAAPGRVALHDLLRRYAADRACLEDSEPARRAAVRRLYTWYLLKVEDAARRLYPHMLRLARPTMDSAPIVAFHDPAAALAWLDSERPNLVDAVVHAAEHVPREFVFLLADALRGYFHLRRYTTDWLAVAHAGLAAALSEDNPRGQAAAWLSLADAYQRQSQYEPAVTHYLRAVALDEQAGWLEGTAVALGNLGFVHWQSGRLQQAADYVGRALAIDDQTGRSAGKAVNLDNLGAVYRELGQPIEAIDSHTRALAIHRRTGSRLGEATALGNLGETYHVIGQLQQAVDHLTSALALHREIGDRGCEAEVLRILAAVHRDAGRHSSALTHARTALALTQETGDRRAEAGALNTLATVEQGLGKYHEAVADHQHALGLAREISARHREAEALADLAVAHHRLGSTDVALAHAHNAVELSQQAGYRLVEGRALVTLAEVHLANGDSDQVVQAARQALVIHRATGQPPGVGHILLILHQAREHGRLDTRCSAPDAATVTFAAQVGTGRGTARGAR